VTLGPLHQIAIASGDDLDAAIAFYREVLRLPFLARFDPPGIAFFNADGVRLMLAPEAPKGQLYLRVDDLDASSRSLANRGVLFKGDPVMIHRDDAGQFGATGVEEWMNFFEDPAGNLVAIAERRAPENN
jgi:catechol 2,3-dioxygenase-like lactoylglutathione lyase family enzyme